MAKASPDLSQGRREHLLITGRKEEKTMAKDKMIPERASRIQSAGDRNSKNQTAKSGFASRAQSAAAKNSSSKGKR